MDVRGQRTLKLNDLEKCLAVKKRTLIFWTDEYGINKYVHHSKGGNRYTEKAVFFMRVVRLLKESGLFSSSFIRIFMQELDRNGTMPELPCYLSELALRLSEIAKDEENGLSIAAILIPDEHSLFGSDQESVFREKIASLKKLLEQQPVNQDEILLEIAEICRTKLCDYAQALLYYGKLQQGSSEYSEIARIFYDILSNQK